MYLRKVPPPLAGQFVLPKAHLMAHARMSTAAQHSKAVTNSPTQAIDVLVDAPPAIPECQHKSSTTDSPDQSPPALALVIRRCHTDSTQSFVLRSETPVHHMYLVP